MGLFPVRKGAEMHDVDIHIGSSMNRNNNTMKRSGGIVLGRKSAGHLEGRRNRNETKPTFEISLGQGGGIDRKEKK